LKALNFEIIKEGVDDIRVAVPFSKPDISIPADIVEELMRIDGLDNIDIPLAISITPSVETLAHESAYSEKAASFLTGMGFNEIFTNSITNAIHYKDEVLQTTVKMLNSLSADLNVMRPQ
jgi:phenylalanyl-tRNA synthetase beta chain